jgi:phosphatidylserine/phosphatidylglycerophosphate/cardiolipin synthase-like enzyme
VTKSRLAIVLLLSLAACKLDGLQQFTRGEADGPPTVPGSAPSSEAGESGLEILELGAGHGLRGPWFEVYFSDPSSPLALQFTGGPDGPLVKAIDSARLSIDVAAYRLDSYEIRRALLRALSRGVNIRVVMEADDRHSPDAQALLTAGIPIVNDGPDGLMHDKFMVLDGSDVWTGSMNFTYSGAYVDNNNLLHIHSAALAANYSSEFLEMFSDHHFGRGDSGGAPNPRVRTDHAEIEVYFSPDDGVAARLEELIRSARRSLNFLAFSFTSDELGQAIRDKAAGGVRVLGVMDADQVQSNIGSEYDAFRQAGLEVRKDGLDGQMHHKVLVVDGEVVVTGSYNFSNSAERRNDENLLIIHSASLAGAYLSEFTRIFTAAKP